MHLGILKVAAVLESKGYEVDMLDLSGIKNYEDVLTDYLRLKDRPSVFGLTATTPQIPEAVKISKFLKSQGNVEKIILGGPHVTLMHTAAKQEKLRRKLIYFHLIWLHGYKTLPKIVRVLTKNYNNFPYKIPWSPASRAFALGS